jgi:hypothetical protein
VADDLLRRMRDHVGYDPERIVSGEQPANRAERRAAKRVLAEKAAKDAGRRGER